MNVYRCKFLEIFHYPCNDIRARVILLDNHKAMGGNAGDTCTTSKLKSIDFERGIIVTQNSMYLFEVK